MALPSFFRVGSLVTLGFEFESVVQIEDDFAAVFLDGRVKPAGGLEPFTSTFVRNSEKTFHFFRAKKEPSGEGGTFVFVSLWFNGEHGELVPKEVDEVTELHVEDEVVWVPLFLFHIVDY